jgi:uncharacterized cupin superfamily protein
MRIITASMVATGLCIVGIALAADAPKPLVTNKPFKLTAADAAGAVFSSKAAVKLNDPGDGPVTDVALLRSRDGRFEAGLYEAGPSDQQIEAYPDDEFIYVLEGGIKLISTDDSVVEAKAGESLSIPKGWKGRWMTQGYKKYYVTYTRK